MDKFRTGNVIKTPHGSIEIVTNVTDELLYTIPIGYENSSSTMRLKSYTSEETCYCSDYNDGDPDYDCEACKGNGHYIKKHEGANKSKVLAPTVKSYILKRLTKNFEW